MRTRKNFLKVQKQQNGKIPTYLSIIIQKINGLNSFIKDTQTSWELMTHTCNPSYSRGRDQEDHGSKPVLDKWFMRHYLKKKKNHKNHKLEDCIKKTRPNHLFLQETYLTGKDKHKLKVKEWKKDCPSKWNLRASKSCYTHM
jgi:hypothetical protein